MRKNVVLSHERSGNYMAKKKKRSHKRAHKEVPKEPNMFLRGVVAVLLIVVAFFLLLGGFGQGGALPKGMFEAAYAVLGRAAYILPVGLTYWGILKFRHEEHIVPFTKIVAVTLFLIVFSAWFHSVTASESLGSDGGTVWVDGKGGFIGDVVGSFGLTIFSKILASVLFFLGSMLLFCWAFGISLCVFLLPFRKREQDEDTDLAELKEKSSGFKLNEGVPVEHSPHRSSLKNTVSAKLTPEENHQALTEARDPNWQFPTTDLLIKKQDKADAGDVNGNADIIKDTFQNFNIDVDMEGANIGPRVTQFTLKPPAGIKLSKISALDRELALNLAAQSIRIEAPIPGKRAVGIEVPNVNQQLCDYQVFWTINFGRICLSHSGL
jgi:S-DNA-T family DNA segregation ATPase FtsK/SpoIIIE